MSDLQTKFVEANGLRFEVLEEGTGDKLALCLHALQQRRAVGRVLHLGPARSERGHDA